MMIYLLKSSSILLVLIIFYKVFLENEKAFIFNRFYLLGAILFSFIGPLITIRVAGEWANISGLAEVGNSYFSYSADSQAVNDVIKTSMIDFPMIISSVYLAVALLLSIRFFRNLAKMFKESTSQGTVKSGKYRIRFKKKGSEAYSFFNYLSLPEDADSVIIDHEKRHANALHSLDIIILEILILIFWFNPLIYWVKKLIQLNHEYYADQASDNKPITHYKNLIFKQINQKNTNLLASSFNYSFIKKRLKMLHKTKSGPYLWVKQWAILPILSLLLFAACEKVVAQTENNKTIKKDDPVIHTVYNGQDVSNKVTYYHADFKEAVHPKSIMELARNKGLQWMDDISIKLDGKTFKGNELIEINYNQEKEYLFMRGIKGAELRFSDQPRKDGNKYRSIKLGEGNNWSVTYDATLDKIAPPPPPPPAPPAPIHRGDNIPPPPPPVHSKNGIAPPPPPPAPAVNAIAPPPPPPPAPPVAPVKKVKKEK